MAAGVLSENFELQRESFPGFRPHVHFDGHVYRHERAGVRGWLLVFLNAQHSFPEIIEEIDPPPGVLRSTPPTAEQVP